MECTTCNLYPMGNGIFRCRNCGKIVSESDEVDTPTIVDAHKTRRTKPRGKKGRKANEDRDR